MDSDEAPIIYGLEFQARSLVGLYGEDESIRFLVGSQSLRSANQVHVVAFDEETRQVSKYLFGHPEGEIWGLTVTPCDPRLFVSTYCSVSESLNEMKMRARVWRLPEELEDQSDAVEDNSQILPLEYVCSMPTEEYGDVRGVISHPGESESDMVCLVDNHLVLCSNPDATGYRAVSVGTLEARSQSKLSAGRWSPHHGSTQLATVVDQSIKGWDLRTMKVSFNIENAHSQLVRDLDYNPNRQYYLASGGDDCKIKFWDVRKPTEPVRVVQTHSHWVWTVRYNPFHDQLLVSGSSDSRVCLHWAASISSEPFDSALEEGDEDEKGDGEKATKENGSADEEEGEEKSFSDGVIRLYEEHEDSVYATEWSLVDPWLFASLSYDGRLVINQVPKKIKFKILL